MEVGSPHTGGIRPVFTPPAQTEAAFPANVLPSGAPAHLDCLCLHCAHVVRVSGVQILEVQWSKISKNRLLPLLSISWI